MKRESAERREVGADRREPQRHRRQWEHEARQAVVGKGGSTTWILHSEGDWEESENRRC